MKIVIFIALAMCLSSGIARAACDERTASTATNTMNSQLAQLVGFTMVQCIPSKEAEKCSITCVTTSLESPDNVSILLAAITATAAMNMRKVGASKFSSVNFADKNLLQKRRYLSISAARADQLQSGFASASGPPELMQRVRPAYTEREILERR